MSCACIAAVSWIRETARVIDPGQHDLSQALAMDFQLKGHLEDATQAWEVAMGRSAQDEDWKLGVRALQ